MLFSLFRLLKKVTYSIEWMINFILLTDMKNHIAKISEAKRLTILANGPSLKDDIQNFESYDGDFLAVNDFYRSPYFELIKPKYYVVTDPLFFVQYEGSIPFLKMVKWPMQLFVPIRATKNTKQLQRQFDNIEVIPYNNIIYNGFERFRYRIYDKGYAMPKTQNVLVASIFVAINMGYKEILLYGVDHSWTESIRVNEKNEVCLVDSHFYDEKEEILTPWYKGLGSESGVNKMHEILRALALMFESYHILNGYASYKGAKIINCTKKSYIDAFERSK